MNHRITISMEMVGAEEWSDLDNDYGQATRQHFSFDVEFSEDQNQMSAIAAAIERLLTAVGPPRPLELLAELLSYYEGEKTLFSEEKKLLFAARKLKNRWERHDEELEEIRKRQRNGEPQ